MKPKEVKKIRAFLGLTQKELAFELGVNRLTVSHWEIGFRKPSSSAVKAMQMLKELMSGYGRNKTESLLKKRFDYLNKRCFGNELIRDYKIQLSRRMETTVGKALLIKGIICISSRFLEASDWLELDETLKHEMVHCWLYEKGKPWGHTKEFKSKLKEVISVGIM